MSFLQAITPINLLEEKEKFFNDQNYNPQFRYQEPFDSNRLTEYGLPDPNLLEKAKNILKKTFSRYSEEDLENTEGPELTQTEVEEKINLFLRMHHLELGLSWSSTYVSRTSITSETIKLRLPVAFRQEGLLGMLYHEIGTHALRRKNYEQQPWYRKKKKYGFSEYLPTEEGLAALHGLLPHSMQLAYKQARLYFAVAVAQNYSFSETWKQLLPYSSNQEKTWSLVTRVKRGMDDTNNPGGYTKDLVYFEGLVSVWNWLAAHSFDCTQLYFGKLAMSDTKKAIALNPAFIPTLPSFFVADRDRYAQQLQEIGKVNGLI